MERVTAKLYNWASDIDPGAINQAMKASKLSIVPSHVALMPDAHVGMGATVGSVIPTENAIIPAAVGVDIGCGMIALETNVRADQLPDNLNYFMPFVREAIPAGLGKWHDHESDAAWKWLQSNPPPSELSDQQKSKALKQFGSLGSGNHFFEVCIDERDIVWLVLHSGSRGIGNQLATEHIDKAKKMCVTPIFERLEDPDLAYFLEGTAHFDRYIADLLWAQDYALANREQMMNRVAAEFFRWLEFGVEVDRINCHHNFTQKEVHPVQKYDPNDGPHADLRSVWITRKGAIKADTGDRGVIPGSMGTKSYIVHGLGNSLSYNSCSHGAGRRLSRGRAKRELDPTEFAEQMVGKVWQDREADSLLDEAPNAYKDIDQVMEDQKDLVAVDHVLTQVLNYKGVDNKRGRRR